MRELKFKVWDTEKKQFLNGEPLEKIQFVFSSPKLMYPQYTGMRDKNGIPIFEGDILYHPVQGARYVEYCKDGKFAGYMLVSIVNGMRNTLQDTENLYKIVGNVFEKPEALWEAQ